MPDENVPKKKSKKKWIIILFIFFILVGLGGGGYYYLYMHKHVSESGSEMTQQETEKPSSADTQISTLPVFLVNLADPLGRRYIKLTLDVEVNNKEAVANLNKNMAKVKDSIILLLSSKSYADLSSMESKLLLKNEIVDRLNQVLGNSSVARVYFTEIIIQ